MYLKFLNHSHFLNIANGEGYCQCVRRVDKFAYIILSHGERDVLAKTIEVARNEVLFAKSLGGFLSVLATRSTYEFKCFHLFCLVLLNVGQSYQCRY